MGSSSLLTVDRLEERAVVIESINAEQRRPRWILFGSLLVICGLSFSFGFWQLANFRSTVGHQYVQEINAVESAPTANVAKTHLLRLRSMVAHELQTPSFEHRQLPFSAHHLRAALAELDSTLAANSKARITKDPLDQAQANVLETQLDRNLPTYAPIPVTAIISFALSLAMLVLLFNITSWLKDRSPFEYEPIQRRQSSAGVPKGTTNSTTENSGD